ncbi:MAG TPA: tetratricopeptide repeat protein [Candidatus Acidoferrum sp.]
MSVHATQTLNTSADAQGRRLESWKEIAAYLGRDVTTVRRWEKREGLPVHRLHHGKLGSIYAYTRELDTWRNQRASAAVPSASDSEFVPATTWLTGRSRRALLLMGLIVTLSAGLAWFVRARTGSPPINSNPRIRSLAVLPLENFSGNPEQDYLSDGMTEALISRLSAIHALRVISRTSVMHFKGTRKSLPAIGKELNVDAVIEGSVLRSGDKIRISIQLIRADTDEHLWSGTYDRELQDVLKLQSEVTYGIAHHIEVAVSGAHPGVPEAPRTVTPEVYESYLKGRFALHKNSRAGLEEAVRHFQAAVDADGTFAPAYAGLAAAYSDLGLVFYGKPPGESRPKVLAAARKALELDPELSEARAELGDALQKDWHWAEAEAEYRQAIELSPNNAAAHGGLAQWLLCQGRTEEALASARRAQELDPQEFNGQQVGAILFYSHRFDEALRELRTTLSVEPNDPLAAWYLGFALMGAKHYDEAITALERAASLSDHSSAVLGVLVGAYAGAGRRADALRVLSELHQRRKAGYVPPAAFLNAYLRLGDKEEAFAWLERCAEERSNIMQFLKMHPFFDPLRSDPRFATFLRRANLQ